MTRSEKIDLLENFSTFLAANGYMDDDWRSEPPYAIDEFLKLTSEPQPTSDGSLDEILKRCLTKYLQEKDKPDFEKSWGNRAKTDIFKAITEAMNEFASLKEQEAHNRAVQECIELAREISFEITNNTETVHNLFVVDVNELEGKLKGK